MDIRVDVNAEAGSKVIERRILEKIRLIMLWLRLHFRCKESETEEDTPIKKENKPLAGIRKYL